MRFKRVIGVIQASGPPWNACVWLCSFATEPLSFPIRLEFVCDKSPIKDGLGKFVSNPAAGAWRIRRPALHRQRLPRTTAEAFHAVTIRASTNGSPCAGRSAAYSPPTWPDAWSCCRWFLMP